MLQWRTLASKGRQRGGRYRPGREAIQKIYSDQDFQKLAIPKVSFKRLVSEIVQGINIGLGFEKDAIRALQAAAEDYMMKLFNDASVTAMCSKRKLTFLNTFEDFCLEIFLT